MIEGEDEIVGNIWKKGEGSGWKQSRLALLIGVPML
jgi:hypothetical protein